MLGTILLTTGLPASLLAQDTQQQAPQQQEDTGDDPSRGVARISVIQGEVNVKRGDSGELVAAALNAPLLAQDHLQTAAGSRAEIQFDSANMVRLAADTDLNLADVRDRHYQLQLATGTVLYRVLRDSRADAEIDTPSISVRPTERGAYRITVAGDGTTEVTVRSGQLEIYSPHGSQTLHGGQTMLARGSSSDPEFQVEGEISRDQFDDWSAHRDQDLLRSRSYQYVSTDVYGADDLDPYGSWVSSSYGAVWAPRVAPGWAPYHNGRWSWEDYYGWTWIDYDPWGWAPFHYGRWFLNAGFGWCWWPGARYQPYYWRPALVGFFGFGSGFGVGFGFGNVGWVPLAPYETWRPWYGRGGYGRGGWGGGRYGNRSFVNTTVINNTNIYNTYRNARINNGVAYSNINSFGRGGHGIYSANGAQIRNASLVRGQLPVAPERSSLAFSSRGPAAMPQRFTAAGNQRFFTHQQPAAVQRVPFAQQQQRMADVQQRILGTRPAMNTGLQTRQGLPVANSRQGNQSFALSQSSNRSNMGAPRPEISQGGQASRSGVTSGAVQSEGWRRFGEGSQPNTAPGNGQSTQRYPASVPRPAAGSSNGSWQRLGQGARSNEAGTGGQVPRPNMNSAPGSAPRSASSGSGWRRFGDPGTGSFSRQPDRPATSGQDGGWHRFGAPNDTAPRSNQDWNRGGNGYRQSQQYGRPEPSYRTEQPMRMNPPIVHDRPYAAPRMSEPRMSAPRMSEPRYSAPSGGGHSSPAPSHSGGGGGNGHSGGGGGGHRR